MNSLAKTKLKDKVDKRAKQVWRQLIKAILIRKYVSDTYDKK